MRPQNIGSSDFFGQNAQHSGLEGTCGSLSRANTTRFNFKSFDCARTTADGMTEEGTAIACKGGRERENKYSIGVSRDTQKPTAGR